MFCECGHLVIDPQIKICPACSKALSQKKSKEEEIYLSKSSDIQSGESDKDPLTYEECPECGGKEAHYTMIQNRSADEPETIFLKCAKRACGFRWKK